MHILNVKKVNSTLETLDMSFTFEVNRNASMIKLCDIPQ